MWASQTKGAKDVRLTLQDDRNLVLYASSGPAWSSNTHTDEAPPRRHRPGGARRGRGARTGSGRGARATATPPPPPPPPAPRTYTVVSGDTLWAIAERFYGDGNKYPQIAEASGISNPDLIHPGQVVTIP